MSANNHDDAPEGKAESLMGEAEEEAEAVPQEPEAFRRAFDPFYSTSADWLGLGLPRTRTEEAEPREEAEAVLTEPEEEAEAVLAESEEEVGAVLPEPAAKAEAVPAEPEEGAEAVLAESEQEAEAVLAESEQEAEAVFAEPAARARPILTEREVKARPVLIKEEGSGLALHNPAGTALRLLATVGAAVTLVGLIDMVVLWFPLGFGIPAWEFGTVTETLDSVPIAGLGWALVTYSIVRYPNVEASIVRASAITFALVGTVILLMAVLYASAVPVVLAEAPDQALGPLLRSIIGTTAEVVIYMVACGVAARLLWNTVGEK